MLVAQVAAVRAENYHMDRGVAALGQLVGAYSAGAVFGSALYRAIELFGHPGHHAQIALTVVLVFMNVVGVMCNGHAIVGEGPGDEHEAPSEHAPLHSQNQGWWFSRLKGSLHHMERALCTLIMGIDLIAANALALFSFSLIFGPASLPYVDIFSNTPLEHGLNVMWFDVLSVVTSGIMVPVAQNSFEFSAVRFFDGTALLAITTCIIATLSSLYEDPRDFVAAMSAGLMLSMFAALSNAVLALSLVQRVSRCDAGIALGWKLFAGGCAQRAGMVLGVELILRHSWYAPTTLAGMTSTIAWALARTDMFELAEKRLKAFRTCS